MRLLVVGGRLQGVEAVYLAKRAGYWVRVVDKAAPGPAMDLADDFLQTDVTLPAALGRAAEGIDLILPALENMDALRALTDGAPGLGIPLAFDLPAYEFSSSKLASDRRFAENRIPAPDPWPACGYPVVVKPSEGSGSEGVRILADADARKKSFGDSFPPEGMVAQEHLEGPSYSVEVVGKPGAYQVLPATELEMDADHDCKRVRMPAGMSSELTARLEAVGRDCAEALNLTGIMDVEVILHRGELKVLEVDARLPSQTPITVYHGSGLNEVALLADLFVDGASQSQGAGASSRGVVLEHIEVVGRHLTVRGEHIMGVDSPLRLVKHFFGADEALATYAEGADTWVATLIITGADQAAAWEKHERVMANLKEGFGLTTMEDPTPERPRNQWGAP